MARNLAENLINLIDEYKEEDNEILLIKIYNYIQEEVKFNLNLIDYGVNELASNIDYIEDEIKYGNVYNAYDLLSLVFSGACINGTLTFSTLQAQMEVNANYDLEEIQEIQNDYRIDNWEQLHIEFCIREFTSYFEEKLEEQKDENPELDDQELLIKTCHSILEEEN